MQLAEKLERQTRTYPMKLTPGTPEGSLARITAARGCRDGSQVEGSQISHSAPYFPVTGSGSEQLYLSEQGE